MVCVEFIVFHSISWNLVCLKSLQKLLESHPDDPKILFNLALTEYALSSFQRTDTFKNQLNKISEKVMQFFDIDHQENLLVLHLASLCIGECYEFGRTGSMHPVLHHVRSSLSNATISFSVDCRGKTFSIYWTDW